MAKIRKSEALEYHSSGKKGKIEVIPTKPYSTQRDLSLAYSPGVAEPCIAIAENEEEVYNYTTKGNLVAVITNGTAVLGLGNIGPLASKPVMEGKGLLFKIFADIDVFDLEVDASDVESFVKVVKAVSPTFGGINLEDIKAPEAFEIERRLKEELDIPVMHDDQHGTAIISSAALINALKLAKKDIDKVKIVISGAGAAAISCARLYILLGAKVENIVMCDSKGVINTSRKDISEDKAFFTSSTKAKNLQEAIVDSDVFLGLSIGGIVDAKMIKSMANNPIVFALANPDPEISYQEAKKSRKDVIVATGRSDNPNQVNNVLGFPFIFRGALDVRATCINDEMKLASAIAIADLAHEAVPESVNEAYGLKNIVFGVDYIIPKPMDPRLITAVAPAVAKAAIKSGVAKQPITDWEKYKRDLDRRMGHDNRLIRNLTQRAQNNPQKVAFAEAEHYKVLKAAQVVKEEGIAIPILLGREKKIREMIKEYKLGLENVTILDPKSDAEKPRREEFGQLLYNKRKRKGYTLMEAVKKMRERNYYGSAMVELGYADALISGLTRNYPDTIKPALQVMGKNPGVNLIAGMYIVNTRRGPMFFADATVNMDPTSEALVEIAVLTALAVKRYRIQPKIAMLSYSNFGSSEGSGAKIVSKAVSILHEKYPGMIVDGEIQANFALDRDLRDEVFPFSELAGHRVNTLIFPNLSSGNISYKIIREMSDVEVIGPVLLGMKNSVHILQQGSSVREIVNMVTIAVNDALNKKTMKKEVDEMSQNA